MTHFSQELFDFSGITISPKRGDRIFSCLGGEKFDISNIDPSLIYAFPYIRLGVLERLHEVFGNKNGELVEAISDNDIVKVLRYAKKEALDILIDMYDLHGGDDVISMLKNPGEYSFLKSGSKDSFEFVVKELEKIFGELSIEDKQNLLAKGRFIFSTSNHFHDNLNLYKAIGYIVELEGSPISNTTELLDSIESDKNIYSYLSYAAHYFDDLDQIFKFINIKNFSDFTLCIGVKNFLLKVSYRLHTLIGILKHLHIQSPEELNEFFAVINSFGHMHIESLVGIIKHLGISSLEEVNSIYTYNTQDKYLTHHRGNALGFLCNKFSIDIYEYLDITYDENNSLREFTGNFKIEQAHILDSLRISSLYELEDFLRKFGEDAIKGIILKDDEFLEYMSFFEIESYRDISKSQLSLLKCSKENIDIIIEYHGGDKEKVNDFITKKGGYEFIKNLQKSKNLKKFVDTFGTIHPRYFDFILLEAELFNIILEQTQGKIGRLHYFLRRDILGGYLEKIRVGPLDFLLKKFGNNLLELCKDSIFIDIVTNSYVYSLKLLVDRYEIEDFSDLSKIYNEQFFGISSSYHAFEILLDTLSLDYYDFEKHKDNVFLATICRSRYKLIRFLFTHFRIDSIDEVLNLENNIGFVSLLGSNLSDQELHKFFSYFSIIDVNQISELKDLQDFILYFDTLLCNRSILGLPSNGVLTLQDIKDIRYNKVTFSILSRKHNEYHPIIQDHVENNVQASMDIILSDDLAYQGHCSDNERHNRPIIRGERYKYICVEKDSEILGHIKLSGDKTFLSYVDLVGPDGTLSLVRGGIYTLEGYSEISETKINSDPRVVHIYDISGRETLKFRFYRMMYMKRSLSNIEAHKRAINSKERRVIN